VKRLSVGNCTSGARAPVLPTIAYRTVRCEEQSLSTAGCGGRSLRSPKGFERGVPLPVTVFWDNLNDSHRRPKPQGLNHRRRLRCDGTRAETGAKSRSGCKHHILMNKNSHVTVRIETVAASLHSAGSISLEKKVSLPAQKLFRSENSGVHGQGRAQGCPWPPSADQGETGRQRHRESLLPGGAAVRPARAGPGCRLLHGHNR
jgi:hypothetical protein